MVEPIRPTDAMPHVGDASQATDGQIEGWRVTTFVSRVDDRIIHSLISRLDASEARNAELESELSELRKVCHIVGGYCDVHKSWRCGLPSDFARLQQDNAELRKKIGGMATPGESDVSDKVLRAVSLCTACRSGDAVTFAEGDWVHRYGESCPAREVHDEIERRNTPSKSDGDVPTPGESDRECAYSALALAGWATADVAEIEATKIIATHVASRLAPVRAELETAVGLLVLLMAWLDPRVIQHLECQRVYTCQLCCEKFVAGNESHKSDCPYQETRAFLTRHQRDNAQEMTASEKAIALQIPLGTKPEGGGDE